MKPTPEHIEEARLMLAAEYDAKYPSYAELALTGTGEFTMCSIRAIATALAEAEERGRMAERERCKKITKKVADDAAEDYPGETWIARLIIEAITKEPTP